MKPATATIALSPFPDTVPLVDDVEPAKAPPLRPTGPGEVIYRHRLVTRLTHWLNALFLSLLLMSGLQIYNAHPRLYWGQYGADADRAFIETVRVNAPDGALRGVTRIGPLELHTTGVLGVSNMNGKPVARGFPAWATLPSYQDLAAGRRWHFFLAWLFVIDGLIYLASGFITGHFRKDIAPAKGEWRPRSLARDVVSHIRLHKATGEAAKRYNPLQKLAYGSVIFVFLPLMLLTGLTMSPGVNAALPFMLDIFGGRQSARTLHFLSAGAIVAFVVIHVAEVFIAGVWNEMRSMITGWYVVKPEPADAEH